MTQYCRNRFIINEYIYINVVCRILLYFIADIMWGLADNVVFFYSNREICPPGVKYLKGEYSRQNRTRDTNLSAVFKEFQKRFCSEKELCHNKLCSCIHFLF